MFLRKIKPVLSLIDQEAKLRTLFEENEKILKKYHQEVSNRLSEEKKIYQNLLEKQQEQQSQNSPYFPGTTINKSVLTLEGKKDAVDIVIVRRKLKIDITKHIEATILKKGICNCYICQQDRIIHSYKQTIKRLTARHRLITAMGKLISTRKPNLVSAESSNLFFQYYKEEVLPKLNLETFNNLPIILPDKDIEGEDFPLQSLDVKNHFRSGGSFSLYDSILYGKEFVTNKGTSFRTQSLSQKLKYLEERRAILKRKAWIP